MESLKKRVLHIVVKKIRKTYSFAGLLFTSPGINHETIQLTYKKQSQMKKFLFVAAIAAFAACNNSASTEAKADSAKVSADSSKMSADTSKMAADSASKMAADTASKMSADTTKKAK
jgi:hypothetical protein